MPRIPIHLVQLLRQPAIPAARQIIHIPAHVASLPSKAPSPFVTLLPLTRSTLLGALLPLPRFGAAPANPLAQQVRHRARGNEYQPSQRVRKRKHGFLARKRSLGGRKILERRKAKGRKFLTH